MKRLLVQDAFVGEPDPSREGLAVWGEEDEAAIVRINSGRLVVVVPPGTPDDRVFEAAQFLGLEVALEDGRTLSLGIYGDAVGAYFLVGRESGGDAREEIAVDLSTIWAAAD